MRILDQTDRDILKLLKHDARASVTSIAAELGVTRVTVKSRMASLKADGVIRRFTIDVEDVADQDMIPALSLIALDLSKAERVHRALSRMPELTSVHSTNGRWSVVARSETRTLAEFDRLLNRIGKLEGVSDVETCLLLSRIV